MARAPFEVDVIDTLDTYEKVIAYLREHRNYLNANPQAFIESICAMLYNDTLDSIDIIVKEFKFDVNMEGDWGSDGASTLVEFACEWRRVDILESALKYGAKLTNDTLECLLLGHGCYALENVEDCEACLRVLVKYNIPRIILRAVLEEDCTDYIEQSPYIRDFLETCQIMG